MSCTCGRSPARSHARAHTRNRTTGGGAADSTRSGRLWVSDVVVRYSHKYTSPPHVVTECKSSCPVISVHCGTYRHTVPFCRLRRRRRAVPRIRARSRPLAAGCGGRCIHRAAFLAAHNPRDQQTKNSSCPRYNSYRTYSKQHNGIISLDSSHANPLTPAQPQSTTQRRNQTTKSSLKIEHTKQSVNTQLVWSGERKICTRNLHCSEPYEKRKTGCSRISYM